MATAARRPGRTARLRIPRPHLPARLRTALALAAVVVLSFAGGIAALAGYSADRTLSVGTINVSVVLGHRGTLAGSVPLVEWGARIPVVHLTGRLTRVARRGI